jgi:ABC-type lipoprotein release transport system permease subunit
MIRLIARNLLHYWRTSAVVVAGVAAAVAVLAGALLVGHSVRASLRELLSERIGAADYAIAADRFFRGDLARDLAADAPSNGGRASCPLISLKGVLQHEGTARRAYDITVYGVDERFWRFHGIAAPPGFDDRAAIVGAPLAAQLAVKPGDGLLLRIESGTDLPAESLFGRRDETTRTIRLNCAGTAGPAQLGEFTLRPDQGTVLSVFVSLKRLQRELAQPDRVNTILISSASREDESARLRQVLQERVTLADFGAHARSLADGHRTDVGSTRILLDEAIAGAVSSVAAEAGRPASGVFAYLANVIRARGREIPYSVIAAADLGHGALDEVRFAAGSPMPAAGTSADDLIWLNEWAWRDLGAPIGEPIDVEYYLWEDTGGLVTRTFTFRLAGVVAAGGDVNQTLAPDVPGVTDARSLRTWDPPFPLDLRRIRPQDEAYWERFRATPKAFVTLARGQSLWRSRFGQLTAVRVGLPEAGLAGALAGRIDPEAAGFTITSVRRDGVDASRGAVDLGEYFLYFSAFLVAAAVLLSASFFRLGVGQRSREVGTLRAVGYSMRTLRGIFVAEGVILLALGSLLGAAGALAYGGALVAGLRTWWVGAVGTERVYLHVSWTALAIGIGGGAAASVGAILWTLRDLGRSSPRALLAGEVESRTTRARRARVFGAVAAAAFAAAVLVLAASAAGAIGNVEAFFGAGALLLLSTVTLAAAVLRRAHPRPITGRGWHSLARLAFRGAVHRPARSLLPVALLASATFIIVSVDAFRKGPSDAASDRRSGTGGYALVATSALPVVMDPATAAGRDALGLGAGDAPDLAEARFVSFRQRPGDEASCLNLYAPREPAILGAPRAFRAEGRFSFAAPIAATTGGGNNPWLLLDAVLEDGVIPAIADANSLEYSLHLAVGGETVIRGGAGASVRLRIVAALEDSILQGALIISEENFVRLFPGQEGYRFFLVDVPSSKAPALAGPLTEHLADRDMRVESARERLDAYHRVENTYLSSFQSLGALGLVLGTAGLLAVLLRNVLERRAELALLRAMGYPERTLAAMIVAEHVFLVVYGLGSGTASALVAIAPALGTRGGTVPVAMAGLLLVSVTGTGLIASLLGGITVLRSPLVTALRSE